MARQQLLPLIIGILLLLLLAALDQTIVGTALPKIIGELKGFDLSSWVGTTYLLTSMIGVLVFGRLSDRYGRKPFLVGGVIVFLLGSALSGTSQNIMELILFRGLQGLGGGAIFGNVFTVIADLFPPSERGKYQGLFGATFGLASVLGPWVGGLLTDNFGWRWIFYVNIPLGLIALAVIVLTFPTVRLTRPPRKMDYLGLVLLTVAIVPLLLGLSWGGNQYAWLSVQVLGTIGLGIVFLIAFAWTELVVERRGGEPAIPLSLWRNDIVAVSSIATLVQGATFLATVYYLPFFMQGVVGVSASTSGSLTTPLMLALVFTNIVGGVLVTKIGRYREVALGGAVIMVVGMFLISRMGVGTGEGTVIINMIVAGLGFGLLMQLYSLACQNAVEHRLVGTVTAMLQFLRQFGSTLGLAVLGSLLSSRFTSEVSTHLSPTIRSTVPKSILDKLNNPQVLTNDKARAGVQAAFSHAGAQGPTLFASALQTMKAALATASQEIFTVGLGMGIAMLLLTIFLRQIPLRREVPGALDSEVAPTNVADTIVLAAIPTFNQGPARGPARAVRMPFLTRAGEAGSEYPIVGTITLGRSPDNVIVIDDPLISRHHSQIFLRDGTCIVQDLGSANGTSVNGRRVEGEQEVHAGSTITVGNTAFVYHSDIEAAQPRIVEVGGPQPAEYTLTRTLSLGRHSDNDIVVKDPKASRRHAEIFLRDGDVVLHDLDSLNGTKVNGRFIPEEQILRNGDQISIGAVSYVYRNDLDATPVGAGASPSGVDAGTRMPRL